MSSFSLGGKVSDASCSPEARQGQRHSIANKPSKTQTIDFLHITPSPCASSFRIQPFHNFNSYAAPLASSHTINNSILSVYVPKASMKLNIRQSPSFVFSQRTGSTSNPHLYTSPNNEMPHMSEWLCAYCEHINRGEGTSGERCAKCGR
jgi:hypothetical protein